MQNIIIDYRDLTAILNYSNATYFYSPTISQALSESRDVEVDEIYSIVKLCESDGYCVLSVMGSEKAVDWIVYDEGSVRKITRFSTLDFVLQTLYSSDGTIQYARANRCPIRRTHGPFVEVTQPEQNEARVREVWGESATLVVKAWEALKASRRHV